MHVLKARRQLSIAIALVAIIPLLAFAFLGMSVFCWRGIYAWWVQASMAGLVLLLALTGLGILRRYPRNLEALRQCLQHAADGNIPIPAHLLDDTEEICAIARALETIVEDMRRRMNLLEQQLRLSEQMRQTIRDQAQQLIEAERHRVMIESLGAAVHHIGQPATVLRLYLDSIPLDSVPPDTQQKLRECREAIQNLADILARLREVSAYRTIPYRPMGSATSPRDGDRILDIGVP